MIKGLFIATPCFGGQCYTGYALSLVKLITHFTKIKMNNEISTISGESLVPIARNELVRNFLSTNLSHMIFIDADLTFETQDVMSMMQLNRPVLGGLYLKKKLDWDVVKQNIKDDVPKEQFFNNAFSYVCYSENEQARAMLSYNRNKKEVFPVLYLGTGFMMIKRETFEKLMPHVQTYKRGEDSYHDFFQMRITDTGTYLSEDFSFCYLCQQHGIQVECAPWTKLLHTGTMEYGSHFGKL